MKKVPSNHDENELQKHVDLVSKLANIKRLAIKENRVLKDEEIETIRKELESVDNLLVLNFDETITENLTIRTVVSALKKELKGGQLKKFKKGLEKRSKICDEYRSNQSTLSRDPAIWTFYEALKGVPKKIIEKVYEQVAETEQLNPYLTKVLQAIQEEYDGELKIYILSLNTTRMLEIYYGKYLKELKQMGVQVVGIMGNDLVYDDNDKLTGILEQVKRENKDKFIPATAVMLADNSETLLRLQNGTNTINIQNYDPDVVKISLELFDVKCKILDKQQRKVILLSSILYNQSNVPEEINKIDLQINNLEKKVKKCIDILMLMFNNFNIERGSS